MMKSDRLTLGLLIGFVNLLGWSEGAIAQVGLVEDTAAGRAVGTTVVRDVVPNLDAILGGTQAGRNLFHSFQEFNIGEGRSAYFFLQDTAIQNVFARVTGSNRSEILGTLGVRNFINGNISNSNSNLYLMNPNGILFGPNARLDVGASFVGTTANAIEFGDRGSFSATNPTNASPLLTINPSAHLFNQVPIGNIVNRSVVFSGNFKTGLRVPNGQSLTLMGGDVSLEGGWLSAWDGRVEIGAVAGTAKIGINPSNSLIFPEGTPRADVSLTNNAAVDVGLNRGGDINIHGNNITISSSDLAAGRQTSLGSEGSQAGNVILNATGNIQLSASQIANSTFGTGNAGNIILQANGAVRLSNSSGILSNVNAGAVGNGGDITINAESLSINRSVIQSITRGRFQGFPAGKGNSGDININLRGDLITTGSNTPSIVEGITTSIDNGASGLAGDIKIAARDILMGNQTQIRSTLDALAVGAPGNIRHYRK